MSKKLDGYLLNSYPIFESESGELILTLPKLHKCARFDVTDQGIEDLVESMLDVIEENEEGVSLNNKTIPYTLEEYNLYDKLGVWVGDIIGDNLHCVIDTVRHHQELFLGELIH